jgi:hypothetical protein
LRPHSLNATEFLREEISLVSSPPLGKIERRVNSCEQAGDLPQTHSPPLLSGEHKKAAQKSGPDINIKRGCHLGRLPNLTLFRVVFVYSCYKKLI